MDSEIAFSKSMEITRREAKNFYFGIRLLPPAKRKALAALYALAREMDDIVDEEYPKKHKLKNLAELRRRVKDLIAGDTSNFGDSAPLWGVYYAARRYDIPLTALEELMDGCEQDISPETASCKTFADTEAYCRLVAGSVGRLSLGVFGIKKTKAAENGEKKAAFELADDLGVALQLTNILRDILEDKNMGRVYLPLEDLEQFKISTDFSGSRKALADLIFFESSRALDWYKRGFQLLDYLDHRSFACTAAMSGIYFRLLQKIRKDPLAVLKGRVSIPNSEKALVVGRSLLKLKP